jgi:hypothetical protein
MPTTREIPAIAVNGAAGVIAGIAGRPAMIAGARATVADRVRHREIGVGLVPAVVRVGRVGRAGDLGAVRVVMIGGTIRAARASRVR